jgi:hypothetical protein
MEIIPALRSKRELARRPLQQRNTEFRFQRGNFSAYRGNRHAKGVCSATKASELRDLHEHRNIIQISHFDDFSINGNVIPDISV